MQIEVVDDCSDDGPEAVVREVGESAVVERRDDGGVVVRVPCTNLPAFRSWVIGLLEHAEVLSPREVRDDLVSWLSSMVGEEPA